MADTHDRYHFETDCSRGSIVSNRDNTSGAQRGDERTQQLLSRITFTCVVLSIGKWQAGLVRMEREHVPQEYMRIDV